MSCRSNGQPVLLRLLLPTMSPDSLLCGPLLRYTWINHDTHEWHGSAFVVLRGSGSSVPSLRLTLADDAYFRQDLPGYCLLAESGHTFWRFSMTVPMSDGDRNAKYVIGGGDLEEGVEGDFWVPGREDSMRIMFHSCNGFGCEISKDNFAGPALWKDVLRTHELYPFHVVIGGGDQVYSDEVRVSGPLKAWADEMVPARRASHPCTPDLEGKIDEWYFQNYCSWYNTEIIRDAFARIPGINIYDDHDIIDGFGSYRDKWMRAPIFLGIGRVAWKYYALFQLHIPPKGEDPEDPSWLIGKEPGPYIRERSRSICTTLGKRIMFFGLDCRTERTLKRIVYQSTYDAMFERMESELEKAEDTTHLILLLGVPIAGYPRLVWAERLLNSHSITAVRLLNKKFGFAGGMFNHFDGSAELLDDLNDHWCAGVHKKERNYFVRRLQQFALEKQIRITILSGDVHLACVGRFFSAPRLKVPQNKDPRYMINLISSAITNGGPPMAAANFLDKRNRVHHLDKETQENMMRIFHENPDGKPNRVNKTTLPFRNYAIITEHAGLSGGGGEQAIELDEDTTRNLPEKDASKQLDAQRAEEPDEDMEPAKKATGGPGNASAMAPASGSRRRYALDCSLRVEIDQRDPEGWTRAYGFSIPCLES
ncbi:hypothetical protein CALCODRAFT_457001 [Calocera cornea HHB12733]|uniref:PhoD-like phosphatase domain-containing protein n=1 Tax=Calocera cornea HHB12733 TaxID=1353952 RepID=A0A165E6J0_9BASI|nr:hypothetical protein CALCODRAFT_457001 [Calocera cornea HHB12733]